MGAAPRLTVLRNGETVGETELEGEISIGRSDDNVVRLDDRAVSRRHAVLRPSGEGIRVEKLSEFGPVSVNGAECTTALVKEGDVISIGPYLMKLSFPKEEPPAPAPAPAPVAAVEAVIEEPEAPALEAPVEEPALADPVGLEEPPMEENGAAELADLGPLSEPAGEPPADEGADGIMGAVDGMDGGLDVGFGGDGQVGEAFGGDAVSADEEDGKTRVGPAANVRVVLVFPPGAAGVTEYEITKDEVVIGRSQKCDIPINDKKASRRNTLIRRAGLSFSVKDLESANGTFVNGVQIDEQELTGDDTIRIGDTEFQFKATSLDYEQGAQDFLPVEEAAPADIGMDGLDVAPYDLQGGAPEGFGVGQMGGLPAMGGLPGAGQFGVAGGDAMAGVAGIPNAAAESGGGNSLLAKFRAMDPAKRKKIIIYAVVLVMALDFMEPEPQPVPQKAQQGATAPSGTEVRTFAQLSPEQKRFVESQHALSFDLYRNKEYDKALFEIQKIFQLIPEYKDAREIERYAKEGKRKLEALKEEKRRKEEEARLKAKIVEITEEAQALMLKKDYDSAVRLFPQVLALDPENQMVARWQKEIDEFNEEKRLAEQQKRVQEEINRQAWDIFKEGESLLAKENYRDAIEAFGKVTELSVTDKKVVEDANAKIEEAEAAIAGKRDPVLNEARQLEEAGEFAAAFKTYEKATKIDPDHQAGFEGMKRIRGTLIEKAKISYTEAVLAESYSDWTLARKKYEETLQTAPDDSEYHGRAKRKLSRFELMLPSAKQEEAF